MTEAVGSNLTGRASAYVLVLAFPYMLLTCGALLNISDLGEAAPAYVVASRFQYVMLTTCSVPLNTSQGICEVNSDLGGPTLAYVVISLV